MAQTQVYTCDICKQSKSKDDLAKLTVRAEGIRIKGCNYNGLSIDVCPECLKKKGFVVEEKEKMSDAEKVAIEEKNKTCLEDKIYDFLKDMGVLFEE